MEEFIKIKWERNCWLNFTKGEMITLLKNNPVIFESALRRGKPVMRAEREQNRKAKPTPQAMRL